MKQLNQPPIMAKINMKKFEKADIAMDKKMGIKENSSKDKKMDKKAVKRK